jgi:hypothetical protein
LTIDEVTIFSDELEQPNRRIYTMGVANCVPYAIKLMKPCNTFFAAKTQEQWSTWRFTWTDTFGPM